MRDEDVLNLTLPGGNLGNKVRLLLMDRAGTLWVGTEGGLEAMRDGEVHARYTIGRSLMLCQGYGITGRL